MNLKPHEVQALRFLSQGPDRIRVVDDDATFAAALVFSDLGKRGLVDIDNEDGVLVTISPAGVRALETYRKVS